MGSVHRDMKTLTAGTGLQVVRPWSDKLGPTLRRLALFVGSEDPFGAGELESASIQVRCDLDATTMANEVSEVRRGADGRFEVITCVLCLAGVAGSLGLTDQRQVLEECGTSRFREMCDRVTHRLVSSWYQGYCGAEPGYSEVNSGAWSARYCVPEVQRVLSPNRAGLAWEMSRKVDAPVEVETGGRWAWVEEAYAGSKFRFDPAFECKVIVGPVSGARVREFAPPAGEGLVALIRAATEYAGASLRMAVVVLREYEGGEVALLDDERHRLDAGPVLGPVIVDAHTISRCVESLRIDWACCRRVAGN